MKAFNQLTRLGKIRRLRGLVLKALEDYELVINWVRFLTIETNTMFEVRAEDGRRFVMRIYSDEETTLRENQAEMFWLAALIRDTDIKFQVEVDRLVDHLMERLSIPHNRLDPAMNRDEWIQELASHDELFFKLYDRLPKELTFIRELLLSGLWRSPERWEMQLE